MARREVPTRDVLMANAEKIQSMHTRMREQQERNHATGNQGSVGSEAQHPFKRFQEPLTCIVCFELASEPFSCPKCQHVCCRPCLDQWFQTQQGVQAACSASAKPRICPGCRSDLSMVEITTNRLAQELIQAMRQTERLSCRQHTNSELLFYCQTCTEPLCTDAIVENTTHRLHEYVQLSKVHGQAKQKIDELVEKYEDLLYECKTDIARYEQLLVDQRYKNEVKLADFMKQVDEQLQRFQADEESECARLQKLMAEKRSRMSEIESAQSGLQARLDQLTKIELVKEASTIIEEIQTSLSTFELKKEKTLPKATSAEDLFNLVPSPTIIDSVEIKNSQSPTQQN